MLYIRPSTISDLDELLAISNTVGNGMTSMPNCKNSWKEKLLSSQLAFNNDRILKEACYFMVLVDSRTQKIAGTTAIYTGIGLNHPFYSYKRSNITQQSSVLKTLKNNETLELVEYYKGATEVGSLFLLPEYRKPGVGKMLAKARYILMADAPQRFSSTVMAELRGWLNDKGQSPLWEALGKHFFNMDFQTAVTIAATQGSMFISELMPKHIIYTDLLPSSAKNVLSKPHDSSAPALHMLEQEGFRHHGLIDLFDGGPSVDVQLKDIETIKNSKKGTLAVTEDINESDQYFYISNMDLENFRFTMAKGRISEQGQLLINKKTLNILNITAQSNAARFIPAFRDKRSSNVSDKAA